MRVNILMLRFTENQRKLHRLSGPSDFRNLSCLHFHNRFI